MTSSQSPRPDALIGCVLDDRYRLEERIGGGGMGQVYRARHLRMDQAVAVKVLHPDLSADPTAARRFSREARHTFRFDHPHCVRMLDFGATPSGTLFLVMEYLTGRTAAQELAVDGPMAPARVMHMARQVCDALAYAHGRGFVHRDIKPDNVMLLHRGGDPDFVKVLDFGLAKLFADGDALLTAAFSAFALTREGSVFGTAEYMSPEQAMGQPLGPTADVYALGVTMYELLTATVPFQGRTFTEVLAQQVQQEPAPPAARRPDLAIPAALNDLVLACMAKQPANRPQSAQALAAELERIAHDRASKPGEALLPASTLATADTMDLQAMAGPATPEPDWPSTAGSRARSETTPLASHAAHAAEQPVPATGLPASTAPTAQSRAHGRGAQRRLRPLAAAIAAVGVAALGLALWQRTTATATDQAQPVPPASALARAAAASPAPEPVATHADAGARLAPQPSPGPALAGASGTPADRARPAPVLDAEDEARRARKRDVARHLEAAEQARRQGNRLKQMAEADSALQLERSNRQAAYLLGDALLAGGDEENGCKYLRRARGLAAARAALRRARCPED
jgi:serine/threonine protein kinase